ncbi:MAG: hypothetical protein WCA20_21250 [Candidatus Sulfotelmatobacter sp.]
MTWSSITTRQGCQLSVGKAPFVAAIKQNICGKVERTIVPGSMEVYPLKGYGAVEIGVHRFHHPGEEGFGEAKFVTVWQNQGWRVEGDARDQLQP